MYDYVNCVVVVVVVEVKGIFFGIYGKIYYVCFIGYCGSSCCGRLVKAYFPAVPVLKLL